MPSVGTARGQRSTRRCLTLRVLRFACLHPAWLQAGRSLRDLSWFSDQQESVKGSYLMLFLCAKLRFAPHQFFSRCAALIGLVRMASAGSDMVLSTLPFSTACSDCTFLRFLQCRRTLRRREWKTSTCGRPSLHFRQRVSRAAHVYDQRGGGLCCWGTFAWHLEFCQGSKCSEHLRSIDTSLQCPSSVARRGRR